nr:VWA domain-containing protein [Melioribacteraceae bacterium]
MRKIFILLYVIITLPLFANGVAIFNDENGICLKLVKSQVEVNVNNQVAVIKTTQTFKNELGIDVYVKYGFPLADGASATKLMWKVKNIWYQANIAATPQDTTHPGGNINPQIKQYLGNTPLYFSIPQEILNDSLIVVELTYVQLLSYKNGKVFFNYPNSYTLIQTSFINEQIFDFKLNSSRTIDSLNFTSHTGATITNTGNLGTIYYHLYEEPANKNYNVNYNLSLSQLGLFGFSTFVPDSVVPDTYGKGFFTFVAEPDPNDNSSTINKRFTFIIDQSGSMYGNTMEQAKESARFVVNNLNPGDMFNLVAFSSNATSFKPNHVLADAENIQAAINFINGLQATGSTNISGAFDVAVPQFTNSGSSYANIILFFTDGEPTMGITEPNALSQHINNLIRSTDTTICLYSFGVGSYVNKQLLNIISTNNKGFASFVGTTQLQQAISEFYLTIRNPVLLNPKITISPNVALEIYPKNLPDMYKGTQLIISGRYIEPANVNIKFSGNAFGNQVEYNYNFDLTGNELPEFQFLPKIWAKTKIEHLLVLYNNLNPNSPEANEIKQQIITLSRQYMVITQFTSFTGGIVGDIEEQIATERLLACEFELIG